MPFVPAITTPADTTVHYEVTGEGAPVVLVHGLAESGEAWGTITDRLSATNRVVVVDLPGHGRSGVARSYDIVDMAADVAAVIAAEGLDGARLVGHSLGGAVVSALAASEFPIHSVVNVDQPLKLDDFQEGLQAAAAALRDPASFPHVMNNMFDSMAGDVLDASEHERLQALRRLDQDVVLSVWSPLLDSTRDALATRIEEMARAIRCPYLAIHGIDPGPAYATWLEALAPGAIVEVWTGFGHYPHLVEPDRFVRRVEAFWTLSD
jgi:pimeloyl-ACP methyl ester carboxylesterase